MKKKKKKGEKGQDAKLSKKKRATEAREVAGGKAGRAGEPDRVIELAPQPPNDNGAKAELLLECVRREGYTAKFDSNGDIRFRDGRATFILCAELDDEPYIQLAYPLCLIYSDKGRAYKVAAEVNKRVKLAKFVFHGDHAVVMVEQLVAPLKNLNTVLERYVRTALACGDLFAKQMSPCIRVDTSELETSDMN